MNNNHHGILPHAAPPTTPVRAKVGDGQGIDIRALFEQRAAVLTSRSLKVLILLLYSISMVYLVSNPLLYRGSQSKHVSRPPLRH